MLSMLICSQSISYCYECEGCDAPTDLTLDVEVSIDGMSGLAWEAGLMTCSKQEPCVFHMTDVDVSALEVSGS
jgi:hypothetical protein